METELEGFLDELNDLVGKLDPKFGMAIMKVVGMFMEYIEMARSLPSILTEPIANIFLHQIVWVLKEFKDDTVRHRTIALVWKIKLFDIKADWKPQWLFDLEA